ncbi:ATP-binding protein [uncultured Bacteroides sp.]|uniref:hybrid sensor histidine kinase/response regulator transcription factor n=1 Tax=uncultured Bacteroides sp. TaxID=162156 RepID=UPI0027DD5BB4|nr:ATP-binding protein [uncultured Bacteroides sp.]
MRKTSQIKHIFCLLIFLIICISPAIGHHYDFKQIGSKSGMPSIISCIYTEQKGFIWIGTPQGLIRFDGEELKKYTAQPDNENSLPGDSILQIIEDNQQATWILTTKGIARYSLIHDKFFIPKLDNRPIVAYSVCKTDDGLLFGGINNIYKYSYDSDEISRIHEFKTDSPFIIRGVQVWKSDIVLCLNWQKGIFQMNPKTPELIPFPFQFGDSNVEMLVDSQQRIWLSTYNNGVLCFSKEGKEIASYSTRNSKLSSDIVLCMTELEGKIWLGTDGGGINILNPDNGEITLLEHISGDNHSLPTNTILCLHGDSANNIWAGSKREGVINIREVSMRTYTNVVLGYNKGLSQSTVLQVYQEPGSEDLWIATDGGGINKFISSEEIFVHYPDTWGDKMVSISNFTSNELLVSAFSKGIFIFDKRTGKKRPLPITAPSLEKSIRYSGQPINLYEDAPHSVLILSSTPYRYDIPTRKFEQVSCAENIKIKGMLASIAHDSLYTYLNDPYNIYKLDRAKNRLEIFANAPQGIYLNAVSKDGEGVFWIASTRGLYTYHPDSREFKKIPTSLFSEVNTVLCDNKGKVWIGAERKLFVWLTDAKRFVLFGETDGITQNEYLAKPRLISPKGTIYMGGVKGLLRINADIKIEKSTDSPEIRLSEFTINGENKMHKLHENKISIPWNSKNIKIRVMTYGGDILRLKVYHYQMGGFDAESYNPELVIPSLAPGTYPILASCNTQEGNLTEPQYLFTLTVLPPWYRTWWFLSLCIICCTIIVAWIVFVLLRRKENKMKWIVKEHEQKVYEEKVRFLINISHELRTPLTLIYAPLSRILKTLSPSDSNYPSLKNIHKQTQRMKDLINMVLDVRKMEVGETKLKLQAHPLNEWIKEVGADFTDEGTAQQLQIAYQLDENIGEVVFDKAMCTIVATNLLTNALKHSPEHSTVTIRAHKEGEYVRISVTDEGEGLKEADMDKVFIRFYQGDGETGGSGIGLSYAKMLVELHKGKIGVVNNEGKGATFFFDLPLEQTAGEVTCQPKPYINELIIPDVTDDINTPEVRDFSTRNHTLLLVDDNRNLTDFFSKELKDLFKAIYIAYDGEEALQIARERVPDIIVSDVMMPRMNGYDLCKAVKEDISISHIPVILLTARTDEQSRQYGYKIGADAYLGKPFEIDTLIKIIQNRLYNREQTKEHYQHVGIFPQPLESTFSQADETFLLRFNKLIRENISNPALDIPFICKEIGMSKTSLYNKLKAITDMGANDYINKFRLEQAIVLVKTTDLTFTEISDQVGFTTLRYFSTAFKQYTGKTPTQYKNECKNGQQ